MTLPEAARIPKGDHEPFESGAFHTEFVGDAFSVYDAYHNKAYLYFATKAEAEAAVLSLDEASGESVTALDAEYARQLVLARASMEAVS
jgi:hypothetical protein